MTATRDLIETLNRAKRDLAEASTQEATDAAAAAIDALLAELAERANRHLTTFVRRAGAAARFHPQRGEGVTR